MKKKATLYEKIYNDIKLQIEIGVLKDGQRLASIRQMMTETNLSRTTIENAYEMLCAKGYVTCTPQSGYYVNSWAKTNQTNVKKTEDETDRKIIYDFTGKTMDENSFDFTYWKTLSRSVMDDYLEFLRYGDPLGEKKLRIAICNYLFAGRGAYFDYNNIVIGAGVQSLLHVICEMFDKEKMILAFENPGFKKGYRIFKDHGYNIVFVNGGKNGINIDELYKSQANMLYISPAHSFPSGASLTYEKRVKLLKWAKDVDGIIIEDDYDGELRFSGKPLSSLMRMDNEGRVIYLGTFSKLLPPSIRISYAVLPEHLSQKYMELSANYNQTSSTIEQLAMSRFIDEGKLEKQVRKLRKLYASKNKKIAEVLKEYFKNRVHVDPNDTGLHMIVRFDINYSAKTLCDEVIKNGVGIIPMSSYKLSSGNESSAEIYFSCASIKNEEIEQGIKIIFDCVQRLDLQNRG